MSEIKDKLCWHFNGERMISESDHITALNQAKIDAVRGFAEWLDASVYGHSMTKDDAERYIEQLKEQGE